MHVWSYDVCSSYPSVVVRPEPLHPPVTVTLRRPSGESPMRAATRPTRPAQVIDHLIRVGRITDATARAQYGSFPLADAVYRLRPRMSRPLHKGMTPVERELSRERMRKYGEH